VLISDGFTRDVGSGDLAEAEQRGADVADRWARALHNLYLVTLVIALIAVVASFPAELNWFIAGGATAVLGSADIAVRRRFAGRQGVAVGYFLATGGVVGVLTAVFPMFAAVAFGLLPLAFVRLPRWGAVAVGIVTTGSPYLLQPFLRAWMRGVGWQPEATIRFGPTYFVVVGVALPVLTGLFTASAVQALRRQNLRRQALLDQLSATRAELASASRLAGRAEERQRLAHELHDTLTQGLSGVVLQLEAAEQHMNPNTARLERLVTRARETARSCLADTRRAMEALRPEPLDDATLADAIAQVCLQWTERAGVPARCVVHGHARRCHPQVEVVALRVVQEALANAGKHAAADEVTVTVEYRADDLHVVVRDDGRGVAPENPSRPNGHTSGGFGLAVMRDRVASVEGRLSVTSTLGIGTTVTATLPTTTGDYP
jgi:signal transduction histidine kinase